MTRSVGRSVKVGNRGYNHFESKLTTTQEGYQRLGEDALDGQATRTRLVVLLLMLRLSRGLLLWCLCCALAGLGDWCTTTDNLLLVVGGGAPVTEPSCSHAKFCLVRAVQKALPCS